MNNTGQEQYSLDALIKKEFNVLYVFLRVVVTNAMHSQ